MEELKTQHQKSKSTYTYRDENDKPFNVDTYNFDVPSDFLPSIIQVLYEFQEKINTLENQIKSLQMHVIPPPPPEHAPPPPPPPEEPVTSTTSSRVKKPINLKF